MTFGSPTHAPLSALSIDSANIRKTGTGAEPQFVATIRAKGIIEPLIVRSNGNGYKVINGGKRLASLQWMLEHEEVANGIAVTEAFPVPIVVRAEGDTDARETSLMTSITRVPAHPVDQYEAFKALTADASGLSPDDVAARFGITRRQVDQALALGALSPKLMAAWRAGEIDAEAAKAFTLAPDHKTQDRIFREFSADGQGAVEEDDVKDRLKANENDAGLYVQFVGVETYESRGGKVTRDLFGVDHVVSDVKLAKVMAEEKLEAECARLISEGWAWALPKASIKNDWQYGHIKVKGQPTKDEQQEIDRLKRIVEDWKHPEHDEAGVKQDRIESVIMLREVTSAQKSASGCIVSIGEDGELEVDYGRTKPAAEKKDAGGAREQRKPDPKPTLTPAEKKKAEAAKQKAAESGDVSNSLARDLHTQLLRATRRALKAESERFPKGGLASILAAVAADLVKPEEGWNRPLSDKVLETLRLAISPPIMNEACVHEFDAKDYFSRVSRAFAVAAVKEAINEDEARKLGDKKSADVVKYALANVPKTSWLPVQLRTPHYAGPAKGKLAAKKKRAA